MSQWPDPPCQIADDGEHHCATCGVPLDPLRAGSVRLFEDSFRFFCSAQCSAEYEPETNAETMAQHPRPRRAALSDDAVSTLDGDERPRPPGARAQGEPQAAQTPRPLSEVEAATNAKPKPESQRVIPSAATAAGPLGSRWPLTSIALGSAGLSLALLLALESRTTLLLRSALALLGALSLALEHPDAFQARQRVILWLCRALPAATALLSLLYALLSLDAASSAASLAGTVLLLYATASALLQKLAKPLLAEQQRQLTFAATPHEGPQPGERIVLHAGDVVMADVTVASGTAEVLAWPDAETPQHVTVEDNLFAGARLLSGQLQATVRWTGPDRRWLRLTQDPQRRVDLHAPVVGFAKRVATRGALLGAALGIGLAVGTHSDAGHAALRLLAILSVFGNPALVELPALLTQNLALRAARKGIAFRSAGALDEAGKVSMLVFCARGTLLLGEPELSSVDTFGRLSQDEVLALVAGVEQGRSSPSALAIARAARARDVQPDAIRSPEREPGRGTRAIASSGAPLVIGTRGLMLSEHISVARAEARITELEAVGREAILVALGGHLVGILALQDGLASGARAAVQHLLDANVEPVLISGDARQTCEALGRTIDIDHIRPEILPAARGEEIQRLQSGGATVAVVGRTPTDDLALSQAAVSVVLPSPGFSASDFDIELADNSVQAAALSIGMAQRGRRAAYAALGTVGVGSAFALILLGLSLSSAVAPLAACVATLVGGFRASERFADEEARR